MIHKYNCLGGAYASGIRGELSITNDDILIITDDRPAEETRTEKKQQIEAYRDWLYEQGVLVDGYWFQTSLWSKINFMGAAALGAGFPGTQWTTMTGDPVYLTGLLAGRIMNEIAVQTDRIHSAAKIHKAALMESGDPAAYEFSTGWPEVFKGS